MRVSVLGATGGIGRAVANELVARGHAVVAVNRSGTAGVDGTEPRAADLRQLHDAHRAVAGADVVVLAAHPGYAAWLSTLPPIVEHTITATARVGARLVYVDNLYAYAPAEGPLTPASPEHATDPKGALRRKLGRQVLDAHRAGRLRASVARLSDYYGPHGTNTSLFALALAPALRGRPMRGFADLDQPHTYHFLPDVGRALATVAEHPEADGRVWLVPAASAITQRALLDRVNAELPTPVPVRVLTPWMLRLASLVNPAARQSRSVIVQFDRPWIVDARHFADEFGPFEPTPHAEAVRETLAWFRSGHGASKAV